MTMIRMASGKVVIVQFPQPIWLCKLLKKWGPGQPLNPQKGEALLCRAYWHFVLANTFCMPYNAQTADTDMGIPYILVPETKPMELPSRGTIAEVYAQIAKDLEKGLPLIDEDIYSVPKYHFNRKAELYAFATRFICTTRIATSQTIQKLLNMPM